MSGLPAVTVIGTLTADPEIRFTQSGHAVANFTVASNDRRKNTQTGEWEDGDATFLRCSIWRQAAECLADSVHRGDRVIVTGRLRQRQYETREGEKRTVFELDADEVGPSLRWAIATVTKPGRNRGARQPVAGEAGSDDPWGAPPDRPGSVAAVDDEPPF